MIKWVLCVQFLMWNSFLISSAIRSTCKWPRNWALALHINTTPFSLAVCPWLWVAIQLLSHTEWFHSSPHCKLDHRWVSCIVVCLKALIEVVCCELVNKMNFSISSAVHQSSISILSPIHHSHNANGRFRSCKQRCFARWSLHSIPTWPEVNSMIIMTWINLTCIKCIRLLKNTALKINFHQMTTFTKKKRKKTVYFFLMFYSAKS